MLDELVVTEVLSIDSEKVTEIVEFIETEVSLSEGEVDVTVGGVVSAVLVWLSVVVVWLSELDVDAADSESSASPQEVTPSTRVTKRATMRREHLKMLEIAISLRFGGSTSMASN